MRLLNIQKLLRIMITATAILIGKILLMLLIIGGMVMILLSVGHLFHNDDLNSREDDLMLRDEVENKEDVVGTKSVFYNFLVNKEENTQGNRKS